MMPEDDWAVPGSFMETSSGDDNLPFSNDDAFQASVASPAADNDIKVTNEDFSKM